MGRTNFLLYVGLEPGGGGGAQPLLTSIVGSQNDYNFFFSVLRLQC